jgi:hypothetical protein
VKLLISQLQPRNKTKRNLMLNIWPKQVYLSIDKRKLLPGEQEYSTTVETTTRVETTTKAKTTKTKGLSQSH